MKNKVLSLLVFLLASRIEDAKPTQKVYCSSRRNEYYLPTIDLCRKCDMCAPGWELESLKFVQFRTTSDHGALGCRRCVRCQDGFYNSKRSYGMCNPCKECETYGKRTSKKCTATSNSKCGKNLLLLPETLKNVSESYVPLANSTNQTQVAPIFFTDVVGHKRKVLFVVIGCSTVIVMFILIVVCLCFRNWHIGQYIGINGKGFGIENEAHNDNSIRNDVGIEMVHTWEIVACLPVQGTSSVTPEENDKLTDQKLMFIGKKIAAHDYLELLLELKVPEKDVRIIEEENHRCCVTRCYKFLKKWMELLPEEATITNLLTILDRIQRHDVVHDFLHEFHFSKDKTSPSELCTV